MRNGTLAVGLSKDIMEKISESLKSEITIPYRIDW